MTELCNINHETEESHYTVQLAADVARLSLEGLNNYLIKVTCFNSNSGQQEHLRAALEINLREEMNSVSIEGGAPYYFVITRRSLDLTDTEIDSSIHEVVDLGLIQCRVKAGASAVNKESRASILFDMVAADLIKASASTLLAQSTLCHREVIANAGHLFANRQDYLRDMCNCLINNAEHISNSIISKTLNCSEGFI